MAESLEGNADMDCDKKMDSLGYSKEQFDRFIHDYRETAEPSMYSMYESDTPIDAALKKDFINVERKLKKTFYAVKKFSKIKMFDELYLRIESMLEIFKTLKIAKEDNKEEFSLDNVPLPDFDPADIELLLGQDFALTQMIRKNDLSKFEDELRKQVIGNIQMAEILLKECDETILSYRKKDFLLGSLQGSRNISSIKRTHSFSIFRSTTNLLINSTQRLENEFDGIVE